MSTMQVITSVLSGLAVLLGAIATYKSSRSQQQKNENDRFENYTTRIEKRLKEVEDKLDAAEKQISELRLLRGKDARWKRIAARHIEELHEYIQKHLGADRNDLPVLPEELKHNFDT